MRKKINFRKPYLARLASRKPPMTEAAAPKMIWKYLHILEIPQTACLSKY
jgi:hypothetical protein